MFAISQPVCVYVQSDCALKYGKNNPLRMKKNTPKSASLLYSPEISKVNFGNSISFYVTVYCYSETC